MTTLTKNNFAHPSNLLANGPNQGGPFSPKDESSIHSSWLGWLLQNQLFEGGVRLP